MLKITGIGAAAARHLAKLGAKVVIVGRNEKRLNEVAELIKKDGSPTPLAIGITYNLKYYHLNVVIVTIFETNIKIFYSGGRLKRYTTNY